MGPFVADLTLEAVRESPPARDREAIVIGPAVVGERRNRVERRVFLGGRQAAKAIGVEGVPKGRLSQQVASMVARVGRDYDVLVADWLLNLKAPLQVAWRAEVVWNREIVGRAKIKHRVGQICKGCAVDKSAAECVVRSERNGGRTVRVVHRVHGLAIKQGDLVRRRRVC